MARGAGMAVTRRRNRRPDVDSPEVLAARLPDVLRVFQPSVDPDSFRRHTASVADWLNQAAPGRAPELAYPVMKAAGLTAERWYRTALS